MRPDMHKIIVERPRKGSSDSNLKTRWHINEFDPDRQYDVPNWMATSRSRERDRWAKRPTDVLSPFRRFLRKQVGRPWSRVYSEIKRGLDTRKATGQHLIDHLAWEVEIHCRLGPTGTVYPRHERYKIRMADAPCPVEGLYVHPKTGLLAWAKPKARAAEPDDPNRVKIDARMEFVKERGLWFIEFFENVRPEEILSWKLDPATLQRVPAFARDVPGGPHRKVVRTKQANRKELRILRARQKEGQRR